MTCLKGLEVNTNIDGRLPLHYASDYGQLEVIKFLCGKVTDPVPTSLSSRLIITAAGREGQRGGQARHHPLTGRRVGGSHSLCQVSPGKCERNLQCN